MVTCKCWVYIYLDTCTCINFPNPVVLRYISIKSCKSSTGGHDNWELHWGVNKEPRIKSFSVQFDIKVEIK